MIRRLVASLLCAALVAAALPPSPAHAAEVVTTLTTFENGRGGWRDLAEVGTLRSSIVAPGRASGHALRLKGDLTRGGWVGVQTTVNKDAATVSFWVRTLDTNQITVRATDGSGQVFQQRFPILSDGQWQQVHVAELARGWAAEHWGGPGDGLWRGPLRDFSVIINDTVPTKKVTVDLDEVSLTLTGKDTRGPEITVNPLIQGNVFALGAQVLLGVQTAATRVRWTILDADGHQVTEGEASSEHGAFGLPPLPAGWYEAVVSASDATGTRSVRTSFAVLAPTAGGASSPLGISTHFAQGWSPDLAPLARSGGYGWVRDELYWSEVETTPGQIVWPQRYLDYQSRLANQGSGRVIILSYGNPLYDGGLAPSSPAAIAAFARYAAAAVQKFGTTNVRYEVWNEWNNGTGGGVPDTSPEAYLPVLRAAATAMRAANPEVSIIAPATAPDMAWLGRLFALGGLSYLDAVSLHPYVFPWAPESIGPTIDEVTALMRAHGQTKPIVVSEIGWPTGSNVRAISDRTQAEFLARSQLIALARGVRLYVTYDLVDDGPEPLEIEHRFGVLRQLGSSRGSYTPRPAYVANAVMSGMVTGARFGAADQVGEVRSQLLTTAQGTTVRALWSTGWPASVTLPSNGPVVVTDLMGRRTTLTPDASGRVRLTVTSGIVFVAGDTQMAQLA